MQLSSAAINQRELVDDIVTLILQRAARQRSLFAIVSPNSKVSGQYDHAATVLRALADELKGMELPGGNDE